MLLYLSDEYGNQVPVAPWHVVAVRKLEPNANGDAICQVWLVGGAAITAKGTQFAIADEWQRMLLQSIYTIGNQLRIILGQGS